MKKLLLLAIIPFFFAGCSIDSADRDMAKKTGDLMSEANRQIGMPAITNFQERKLAKMIFELRDKEDLITYTYVFNRNDGSLKFIGKSIGYGLPYSIQYTNPMVKKFESGSPMPQADPNGLFMPEGLSATWIMLIDPETEEARPVYIESEIIVSPFPLN